MDFLEHSLAWCRGEIFAGKMILLFGVTMVLIAFFFWKAGQTPYARAMIIPVLILGILMVSGGSIMVTSNPKRMVQFEEEYNDNPAVFIKSEKKRTDEFIKWYPRTAIAVIVIAMIAMIVYALVPTPLISSVCLSIVLLGFSILVIDHFSKERAAVYSEKIQIALDEIS